ncbi:MAG: hypothetical protein ACTJGR_00020 [Pauljensenia sp.]
MDDEQGTHPQERGNDDVPPTARPPEATAAGNPVDPRSSVPEGTSGAGPSAAFPSPTGAQSSQPAWVLPVIVTLSTLIVVCLLVLGWWLLSGRPESLSSGAGQQSALPGAQSGQSGQEPGTQSQPSQAAPSTPAVPAPSLTDLANATVRVPPQCAAFAHHGSDGDVDVDTVTFSGGVAPSTDDAATITLKDRVTTTVSGTPVAVVSMQCFGGGSYASDSIGVYDGSLNLVASAEPWADGDVGGYVPDLQVQDLAAQAQDSTVSFTVPAIGIFGDESCHGCAKSASAALTYQLSTGALTLSDVVYRTPSGSVRPPDVATLQTFVEAVSTGDDQKAATWASPDELRGLEGTLGGPESTITQREAQFPPDSKVVGCALVGPLDDSIANTETVADKPVPVFQVEGMRAGDFVCPVVSEHSTQEVMSPSRDEYSVYLVVHSDERGNPFVYFFGRNFS